MPEDKKDVKTEEPEKNSGKTKKTRDFCPGS